MRNLKSDKGLRGYIKDCLKVHKYVNEKYPDTISLVQSNSVLSERAVVPQ